MDRDKFTHSEFLEAAGCQDYQSMTTKIDFNEPLVLVTTRPIIHPRQFFGSLTLLERIFNGWRQIALENAAVVGTKLLCHLYYHRMRYIVP